MDEMLSQILNEIKQLRAEVKEFRESQDVTNKLIAGDVSGLKSQFRDMRDDLKEWKRSADRKIDRIEDRLDDMRDALSN